jgi:putative endonuclease
MKVETTIQEASPQEPASTTSGWRITLGRLGERRAIQALEELGWQIIATNWRCGRFGEIDIIARDTSKMLIFCEVKTRMLSGHQEGFRNEGFEAVHWKKRRKIVMCAMNYMREFSPLHRACRFDVIAVEYQKPNKYISLRTNPDQALDQIANQLPIIRHVQGAFC